jgi:hypothetical protein
MIKPFLWLIDNYIATKFLKNIFDEDRGLAKAYIETLEFDATFSKILEFRFAILFDRSIEIRLSSKEINSIFKKIFEAYSVLPLADKAFYSIEIFEIQDEEIIVNEITYFFILPLQSLMSRKTVKIEIIDGKVEEFFNNLYVREQFQTHLIDYILGLSATSLDGAIGLDLIYSYRSKAQKASKPLISKIKEIKIVDNMLVLKS